MKIWAVILSLFILLLAGTPCCLFDNCPDDKAFTEHSDSKAHDKGDKDGCGTCSPFFNCSTCSSLFTVSHINVNVAEVIFSAGEAVLCQYTSAIPENHPGTIWQPPKIA